MRYTTEIDINQPLEKVIALFDDPDNLKEWQPGLLSFEHLEGEPGQAGAKSRLLYRMGKRDTEMIETILTHDLPREFSGTYEANNVWNHMTNRFEIVDATTTRWISENEFKAKGLFMKLMIALMPGAFKKQTRIFMQNFKAFAEGQPVS